MTNMFTIELTDHETGQTISRNYGEEALEKKDWTEEVQDLYESNIRHK